MGREGRDISCRIPRFGHRRSCRGSNGTGWTIMQSGEIAQSTAGRPARRELPHEQSATWACTSEKCDDAMPAWLVGDERGDGSAHRVLLGSNIIRETTTTREANPGRGSGQERERERERRSHGKRERQSETGLVRGQREAGQSTLDAASQHLTPFQQERLKIRDKKIHQTPEIKSWETTPQREPRSLFRETRAANE
jgi:hypothetical protein